jgi:hypothetical protein
MSSRIFSYSFSVKARIAVVVIQAIATKIKLYQNDMNIFRSLILREYKLIRVTCFIVILKLQKLLALVVEVM